MVQGEVGLELNEMPRDVEFCAWAILEKDILEICDTLEDDRFADNPLVLSAPQIRFYAGAPLRTPEGEGLGTVCVIDSQPRTLTEDQREGLRSLSRITAAIMEARAPGE